MDYLTSWADLPVSIALVVMIYKLVNNDFRHLQESIERMEKRMDEQTEILKKIAEK